MRIKQYPIFLLFWVQLLILPLSAGAAPHQTGFNYQTFFSQGENFFLIKPDLLSKVFLSMIDLKGNSRHSKNRIVRQIMGCPLGPTSQSNCKTDYLILERKELGITKQVQIDVNFTNIAIKRFSKTQSIVNLSWEPELIRPSIWETDQFLSYINVGQDSRFFKVKKELTHILFSARFDQKLSILVHKRIAENLLNLYQEKPTDFKDTITFRVNREEIHPQSDVLNVWLHLKAKRIRINHLKFKVENQLLM